MKEHGRQGKAKEALSLSTRRSVRNAHLVVFMQAGLAPYVLSRRHPPGRPPPSRCRPRLNVVDESRGARPCPALLR